MPKKNNEKVIYLVADADKKAPLINLYSLPTKCPVCNSFQEPKPISFQYNHNDDAVVKFSCVSKNCESFFSVLYIGGGGFVNKQYYFLCYI
ncbi:hypothetical protein J32TS6_12480 [Virgibacillus pantothenticus]|uniref:hypothetical protein n=1 Tax=Virgibacillus pantothenticus TaxID=1473 RepID=UPI001B21A1D0|nr:hypothetical protein [Virgibacillus pantothenticus]GIP62693.1 hypothetical protein J32TS6_12480 [Virgibacillus pantothenticus]